MPGLDEIALPPAEIGPPANRFAELVWMRRWAALSTDLELLLKHAAGERVLLEDFAELGEVAGASGEEGVDDVARFVRELLDPLVRAAVSERDAHDMSLQALVGWRLALDPHPSLATALRDEYPHLFAALNGQSKEVAGVLRQRMWRGGKPTQLQAGAAPGLRRFVGALVDGLEDRRHERTRVPSVSKAQAERALTGLLSPRMLEKMGTREVTQVQRRAYPRLDQVVRERESMLVLGPPGCGKSWIGQVVAAHAVESARREGGERHALVLVPTKAMVRESLLRWQAWTGDEEPGWRVVAGSADDREYDEALAEGDFDVGIAVYEKLAGLIFSQHQVLDRVGVIVVDELQNLGHRQKGVTLESLLTALRMHWPHIPIVGLSATMNGRSVKTVCRWLGVRHLVETHARSTDLRVRLFDGVRERTALFPGATSDATDATDAAEAIDEGPSAHPLPRPASWKGQALASRADQLHVKTPILQVSELLRDADQHDRRILCFVRDRERAADVATLLRDALSIVDPRDPVPTPRNPWVHGRYAGALDPEAAEAAYRRLLHVDSHRWRSDAQEGLLGGIAYHTGALQADLRQMLEEEFKGGLLRCLVCTETLAEGVNLPASDVVLVDLTRYTPEAGGQVPIGLGDYKNRIGRAGRLGTRAAGGREQGHAWVFVDHGFNIRQLGDGADDRIIRDLDAAWAHWVLGRAEEETMDSALSDASHGHANLCGLVLRTLAVHKHRLTREQMLDRIDEIMAATYWTAGGGQADAAEILSELERDGFMQPLPPRRRSVDVLETLATAGLVAEDDDSRLQITRLGLAIARSSLPLESSLTIKRIAEHAGSHGVISLLVEAAQDSSVTSNLGNKWLGWKVDENLPAANRDDVMKLVHAYARLYAHPDRALRQQYAEAWTTTLTSPDQPPRPVAPSRTLTGRDAGPLSGQLEEWLVGPPPRDEQVAGIITAERAYATAVLRATIAYEWASFEAWDEIYARLQRIKSRRHKAGPRMETRDARPAIAGSPTDVAQLAERIAHLISSASEFVDQAPEARQRLQLLAEQLKSGVPHWLQPLWKMRERGLTREVILKFHRTGRKPTDDLERVLSTWREVEIDDDVRTTALIKYRSQRDSQELRYQRVPRRLEGRQIQSEQARPYASVFVEFMAHDTADRLAGFLGGLLLEHAITLETSHRPAVAVGAGDLDGRPVEVWLLLDELTEERLPAQTDAGGIRRVLVPMKSPSWMAEAALDEADGQAISAITPRAFFVLLAELRDRFHQHGDLTSVFLEALTSVGGFTRHGHELVEHASLPSAPPRPDLLDVMDQLLARGQSSVAPTGTA